MPVPITPGVNVIPALSDLDDDIAQLKVRLQIAQKKRDDLAADQDAINNLRPPGIPANWCAAYDGSGPSLRVTAWYDPSKYGRTFHS